MVKGTRFSVSVDDAGAAVSVFRGLVGVRGLAKAATREVLVHEGFTATGARSVPFTLDLMRARTDAWEGWSKQEPRPVPEAEARSRPGGRPDIEFAKDATRMTMAKRMARHLDREGIGRMRPGGTRGHEGRDPIADSHDEHMMEEIQESYAENTLGAGGNFNVDFITSGGPNAVHITGPSSLDQTLYKEGLEQVIGQGDFSILGPQLLNILTTQGIDPKVFADNLLQMF